MEVRTAATRLGLESARSAPVARIAPFLHALGATVLLLFSASHFGFLQVADINHGLRNTVFPFFTNWHIYLVAAVLEALTAVAVFKLRGRDVANGIVLTFVGLILGYRWAFHFTGGTYCGCLGLLGLLLKLDKVQERYIPIAGLVILVITCLPWLSRTLRNFVARSSRKSTACGLLLVLLLQVTAGAQTITVQGHLDIQDYNPRTGAAYPRQRTRSSFSAIISGDLRILSVTNLDQPIYWASFIFDGTNSISLLSSDRALVSRSQKSHAEENLNDSNNPTALSSHIALIEPSSRYIVHSSDNLGLSMVWMTYALSPALIAANHSELPMPSGNPRNSPAAFGYKWIEKSSDSRFVWECEIVRDSSLDLKERQELLRNEVDYPETLGQYNQYVVALLNRKDVPTGFVRARYKCVERLNSAGIELPKSSRYEVYLSPEFTERPWRVVELAAAAITESDDPIQKCLPEITAKTRVVDYRYKRRSNSRIFKYAEYNLMPGDSWKTGHDPVLLAAAQDWLKNGRKFTDFANRGRVWAAWALLALLGTPLVAWAWRLKKKKAKKRQ